MKVLVRESNSLSLRLFAGMHLLVLKVTFSFGSRKDTFSLFMFKTLNHRDFSPVMAQPVCASVRLHTALSRHRCDILADRRRNARAAAQCSCSLVLFQWLTVTDVVPFKKLNVVKLKHGLNNLFSHGTDGTVHHRAHRFDKHFY